jgi:hypothetical protein
MEDEGMPQIAAGSGIDPVDRYPGGAHKPEEIVAKLRQVDVLVSQGRSVAEAVRSIGVTQFTCYRWRKEFGGLKTDQVKRLKELEKDRAFVRHWSEDNGEGASPEGGLGPYP